MAETVFAMQEGAVVTEIARSLPRRVSSPTTSFQRALRRVGLGAAVHLAVTSTLAACAYREEVPAFRAHDARFGWLGGSGAPPPPNALCASWGVVVARDRWAKSHVSFPEVSPDVACFANVDHRGRRVSVAPPSPSCGYPGADGKRAAGALASDIASREMRGELHALFACGLPAAAARAAQAHDLKVLRRLAATDETYPYVATAVFGEGLREQAGSELTPFRPGDTCRPLNERHSGALGAMPVRAARAADALRGGVAPVIIASGGAVRSPLVEAFALLHLLTCAEGAPPDQVLVEPCADHTHTNLRNVGRWIRALGGRAAYVVTDDGLQAKYLSDFSGFELVLGSVDQRSLRDFGALVGAWRQASTGTRGGFWYSPYRFWAEPREALGSATCVDAP